MHAVLIRGGAVSPGKSLHFLLEVLRSSSTRTARGRPDRRARLQVRAAAVSDTWQQRWGAAMSTSRPRTHLSSDLSSASACARFLPASAPVLAPTTAPLRPRRAVTSVVAGCCASVPTGGASAAAACALALAARPREDAGRRPVAVGAGATGAASAGGGSDACGGGSTSICAAGSAGSGAGRARRDGLEHPACVSAEKRRTADRSGLGRTLAAIAAR